MGEMGPQDHSANVRPFIRATITKVICSNKPIFLLHDLVQHFRTDLSNWFHFRMARHAAGLSGVGEVINESLLSVNRVHSGDQKSRQNYGHTNGLPSSSC